MPHAVRLELKIDYRPRAQITFHRMAHVRPKMRRNFVVGGWSLHLPFVHAQTFGNGFTNGKPKETPREPSVE